MKNDNSPFSPRDFWEEKILNWEEGRYGTRNNAPSLLEKIANSSSDSLRFRMQVAGEILSSRVAGKNILEIGCGSGLMAEGMVKAEVQSYTGIDITESAIENAKRIANDKNLGAQIHFETGNAEDLPNINPDLVFSLGLFDWLSNDQLHTLFERTRGAEFMHSFSENRGALSQLIHKAYCYIAYGYKTRGYVPIYHTVVQLSEVARQHGFETLYVTRDSRMSFGSFLTTFPVDGSEVA